MPTYVIEREIPGAGRLSAEELRAISQKSVGVLNELAPKGITWLHSYVTGDKIFCIYEASGTAIIEEHARCMGIPANHIYEVHATISPATAR